MTDHFDYCLAYVLENEGGWSNDPDDHGGATMYGITYARARQYGYDVRELTLDQAKLIYRAEYFEPVAWITNARVCAKAMDVLVNCGVYGGAKILQRAARGIVVIDGIIGPETRAALLAMDPEDAIERISQEVAAHYVNICRRNPSQMTFLLGWIRRAIRRPVLATS